MMGLTLSPSGIMDGEGLVKSDSDYIFLQLDPLNMIKKSWDLGASAEWVENQWLNKSKNEPHPQFNDTEEMIWLGQLARFPLTIDDLLLT